MRLWHRLHRDLEAAGHLFVGEAAGDEAEHLRSLGVSWSRSGSEAGTDPAKASSTNRPAGGEHGVSSFTWRIASTRSAGAIDFADMRRGAGADHGDDILGLVRH